MKYTQNILREYEEELSEAYTSRDFSKLVAVVKKIGEEIEMKSA